MTNIAPIFLRNSLQLGTYANSTALRAALLHWCYSSRNSGANPTVSAGNGTSADDDRMQVDSLKKGKRKGKGKNQHQRGNRTTSTSSTDIDTCKNCGKPGLWAKDCWNPGGGPHDNSTCRNSGKGKSKHTSKGKGKHVDVVETEQPQPSETASTVSYPSQDPSVIGELSCISSVDPWTMGVTLNSVSYTRRQAGAEYLLLDSGAQLHACPITYSGQKIPLPDLGIYTASGFMLLKTVIKESKPMFFATPQKLAPQSNCLAAIISSAASPVLSFGYAPCMEDGISEDPPLRHESSQCICGSCVNRLGCVGENDCKIGEVGERTCAGGQCHVRQGTRHDTLMT